MLKYPIKFVISFNLLLIDDTVHMQVKYMLLVVIMVSRQLMLWRSIIQKRGHGKRLLPLCSVAVSLV